MKIFCSYAFTGEDFETTIKRLRLIADTLDSNGHTTYCNRFDPQAKQAQDSNDIPAIFDHAFKVLKQQDVILAIITSPNKSAGQLMEIGAAISQGLPFYLVQHYSAVGSNYLPRLATKYFEWTTPDDLVGILNTL